MRLDLTDEETFALLNLLVDTIEADRYPMSPRIRLLRAIVRKFGEVGGLSKRPRAEAPPLCTAATGAPANARGTRPEPGATARTATAALADVT
jgi:hypothetical protein